MSSARQKFWKAYVYPVKRNGPLEITRSATLCLNANFLKNKIRGPTEVQLREIAVELGTWCTNYLPILHLARGRCAN